MTLSEIASFVCTKMMDTEAPSVAVCKDFIKRRYQMIWDSAVWTETLGTVSQAVAADTAEVAISSNPTTFYYPTSNSVNGTKLDFVVAAKFVKTGEDEGQETINSDWLTFFQTDPGIFENISARRNFPSNYVNLPKDAAGNCRIRLVPATNSAGTLFVLGKLKLQNLTDNDSATIRGVDNALLSFAEGDMYERARQMSKAQVKFTEAAAHIQVMRDVEKGQQQSVTRIIPHVIDEWRVTDIY